MSWAKLDDRYDDHPKVRQAWREHPATVGVHAMAITHSARYGTDGLVAAAWLRDLMPHWAQRKKVLAILVSAGLFDAVGDGSYRVHDFLDYNPSRLSRAKLSSAAREAALVRWSAERTAKRNAPDDADGMRLLSEPLCPSRPDPTHKAPPTPPRGGPPPPVDPIADTAPLRPGNRLRDIQTWREQLAAWGTEHFPNAAPDAVNGAVSWLAPRVAGPVSADDLRDLAAGSETWAHSLGLNGLNAKAVEA